MNSFLTGMRIFAAMILSILLVLVTIFYSLYFSISSFATPQKITQLVQDVIPTVLPNTEDMGEALPIEGLDDNALTALLQSDTAGEIVELYTQDVLDAVLNGSEQHGFTAEALKAIVGDNMTEVVEIIRDHLPEESSMTDADITAKVNEAVDANAEKLVETMSEVLPAETLSENIEGPLPLIRSLLSPWITTGFLLTILFCASMIILCRLQKLRWMKWLAVISLIVAAFTGLTALLSSGVLFAFGGSMPDEIAGVASLILGSFRQDLTITAIITLVIGIALISTYIIFRRKGSKAAFSHTEETV